MAVRILVFSGFEGSEYTLSYPLRIAITPSSKAHLAECNRINVIVLTFRKWNLVRYSDLYPISLSSP